MCTRNRLILGVFSIFTVGLQAQTTLADYEMPPSIELPLHSDSQVVFSQFLDVPMLNLDELKHAFPWIDSARPVNAPTDNETQNKLKYVFYFSPSEVVVNRSPDTNGNTNSHFDSKTSFSAADRRTPRLDANSDSANFLLENYHPFQDRPGFYSNFNYGTDIFDSDSSQRAALNQHKSLHVPRKLGENCKDLTRGDCINISVNLHDKSADKVSYPSDAVNNNEISSDNLRNEGAADVKREYQQPEINGRSQNRSNLKNAKTTSDKISKINNVNFDDQRAGQSSRKKHRNDKGSRGQDKHNNKTKCTDNRQCNEQNKNLNNGQRTFLNEESKERLLNHRAKSEELPSEHYDNTDVETTESIVNRSRKQRVGQSNQNYRNDDGSREKDKYAHRTKCTGNKACGKRNKNLNNGQEIFLNEESKKRLSNYRTKSKELPLEHRGNSEIIVDRSRKQPLPGVPSPRRNVSRYPKVPSPYMEPPKLTIPDEKFYTRRSRNKRQKRKKITKENDKEDRLKNHRMKSKQEITDSNQNLKNHKTEYVRDHAPDRKEEKSEAEVADVQDRAKKQMRNPLELSTDGERIHFQIHGHKGPDSYIFGYDTGEGTNRHFRLEERLKDGTVKGHYGYYDPLGKLKMVEYSAKPMGGYQEKHHESSDYKS